MWIGGKSLTVMNSIARVFPRKTKASPVDSLSFFGAPTIENLADCIKADVTQVHISVTFTWDIETAEGLYYAWQVLGVPVEVGGPAFDDRMGDFTPGMYLRDGYIFTSRGCTKECWFCSVPRCAHGQIKELPAADVAEVVRCKDCKHRTEYGNCGHPRQKGVLPSAYPFDFCSYGKPKKGK